MRKPKQRLNQLGMSSPPQDRGKMMEAVVRIAIPSASVATLLTDQRYAACASEGV
jgi:hypothetical protein